jgi:carbamoyl-phosphate synthase large subunit
MARSLKVLGLMNVQYAIQKDKIFVLEVNPRASRTVPYVSKATGLPLAMIAARCMAGKSLKEQGYTEEVHPPYFSVKEAVFPFAKFPGVDTILGPEMKSTGEVMGVGQTFGEAFVKSQLAAGVRLPQGGRAFISVRDADKIAAVQIARDLLELGFTLLATRGTAGVLKSHGIAVVPVNKVAEGRPHIVDMIKNGEVSFIVNTTEATRTANSDSRTIRTTAVARRVTYYTTVAGAKAACAGMKHLSHLEPYRLQDLHARLRHAAGEPVSPLPSSVTS